MSQDIREVEESVCRSAALVCNMGAIDFTESMILAGKKARNKLRNCMFMQIFMGKIQKKPFRRTGRAETQRFRKMIEAIPVRIARNFSTVSFSLKKVQETMATNTPIPPLTMG